MKRVKEGTDAQLTVSFFDEDDELVVPQEVHYKINCVEDGQLIRDWTELTPSSEISIALSSEDNATILPAKGVERHEVTVRARYGTNEFITDHYVYEVANLRFLQS